jgi:hypothetical protein
VRLQLNVTRRLFIWNPERVPSLLQRRRHSLWAPLFFAIFALVAAAGTARAQAITLRGNYWRDRNTRVLQPTAELSQTASTGTTVGATYLLDAITSASVAAGVQSDQPFTELRNEIGFHVAQRLGNAALAASYSYSSESDYWAHTASLSGAVDLAQHNTTLAATLAYGNDKVGQRMGPTVFSVLGGLQTINLIASVSQVLSPTLLLSLSYDLGVIGFGSKDNGFQANPYRTVLLAGSPSREMVPYQRFRQAFTIAANTVLPIHSRLVPFLAFRPSYRLYFDDWGVLSSTPELRTYLPIGLFELRFTGRYYSQSAASFWRDQFGMPAYVNTPVDPMGASGALCTGCYSSSANGVRFFTSDPKLSSFSSAFVEVRLLINLRFLERWSRWLSQGVVDVAYGHLFNGGYAYTAYGDAEVAGTTFIFPM